MSVFPTLRSLTLLAAVALSLMGCKQGDGEVCDVVGDCETGLVCCGGGTSGLPLRRGICQPAGDVCRVVEPRRDAGPPTDGGPRPDAGPTDAGGAEDAGTVDAGTVDAGTDDAGTVEDGGIDAGTIEDAGSDAGDAS